MIEAYSIEELQQTIPEDWNENPHPICLVFRNYKVIMDAKFTDFSLPFTIRCRCLVVIGKGTLEKGVTEGEESQSLESNSSSNLSFYIHTKKAFAKSWFNKAHFITTGNENFDKKYQIKSKSTQELHLRKLTELFQDSTLQQQLLLLTKQMKNGIIKLSKNHKHLIEGNDHYNNNSNHDQKEKNGNGNSGNNNIKSATKAQIEEYGIRILSCCFSDVRSIDKPSIISIFQLFTLLLDKLGDVQLLVPDFDPLPFSIRLDGWASLQWVKETSKPT